MADCPAAPRAGRFSVPGPRPLAWAPGRVRPTGAPTAAPASAAAPGRRPGRRPSAAGPARRAAARAARRAGPARAAAAARARPRSARRTWSRSRSSSVPGASPALRPPRLISETTVWSSTSSTRDLPELLLEGGAELLLAGLVAAADRSCGDLPQHTSHASRGLSQRRSRASPRPGLDQRGAGAGRRWLRRARARARARRAPARSTSQALERPRRGYSSARLEVDQLAVQPVADRPPQVLLDQAAAAGRRRACPRRSRARPGRRRRSRSAPASASDSAAVDWASQMRTSTVPNERCGPDRPPDLRVLDDRARARRGSRRSPADVAQSPNGSGTPQRGKHLREDLRAGRVQAASRGRRGTASWRRRASSTGSTGRRRSHARTARSAPRTPTCTCRLKVLLRQATYFSPSSTRLVVLGVDDVLLAVVGPRMGAGGPERDAVVGGEREQAPARRRAGRPAASARSSPRPERISISEEISSPAIDSASTGSPAAAASRSSSKRGDEVERAGSRIANSSSSPTVKSVEASKTLRGAVDVDGADQVR